MNKKNIVFIIVLITVIALASYVLTGSLIIKNKMSTYLEDKGYSANEIQNIEVKHSFLNILLSYNEWIIKIKYTDEPNVIYIYTYKDKKIITNGIAGGEEKGSLKHDEDYK